MRVADNTKILERFSNILCTFAVNQSKGYMRGIIKQSIIFVAVALLTSGEMAYARDFDLASQRKEKRECNPVDGMKLRHDDWVINPTPHSISIDKSRSVKGVSRLIPKIKTGEKPARKARVKSTSGAYRLTVDSKGINIVAFDERGAFYAEQTLQQLLQSPMAKDDKLAYTDIIDWPDLPMRGVVEGFYGTPWSHAVRLSLIDYYGRNKMNTYIYGPKDDPYHSCPNWRLPYPEAEADKIRELAEASRRNHVDFVWAIHPGQDIKWNEEDYRNLVNKFNIMYDLGVRHFAIFFDDISGEGTNPARQVELLNRLNADFVHAKKDVGPLTVCPTDYSKLWAQPGQNGPLAIYGKTLDKDIRVFWTGDVVCSDLTPSTLDFVNSRINRPAFYWWNFPVSDYCRNYLLLGPVYGLDTTINDKQTCGVVSNPMEHGEASKIALYGVADYSWNVQSYNPLDNWERGICDLVPEVSNAYRLLAIHTTDTQTGYRRDESWETETFCLSEWNDSLATALEWEFAKIEQVPSIMEHKCKDTLLLNELRPWLTEFGLLGKRGQRVIQLAREQRKDHTTEDFWNRFVETQMTSQEKRAYEAHKTGSMKLQPFYENMMEDMGLEFIQDLFDGKANIIRGIGSYANATSNQSTLMLDSDMTTYYTSGVSQRAGDWIGVDLTTVKPVKDVVVRQGRNSEDDCDFYDHACIESSIDGKSWSILVDSVKNQYEIEWHGAPIEARYVRLRRLDSHRTNWASVRIFDVNPTYGDVRVARLFDRNISHPCVLSEETVGFEISKGSQTITILSGIISSHLELIMFDDKSNQISTVKLTKPFTAVMLPSGVRSAKLTGSAEIY